jgi:hypothetical protein
LYVQGKNSEVKIRFHEDTLNLILQGDVPGGTEVRLQGKTNKTYEIRLERGRARGVFEAGPIEAQASRVDNPLLLVSPVARVEIQRGQQFEVSQEKTHLWKNYSGTSRRSNGKETIDLYFDGFSLDLLRTQHLPKILKTGVSAEQALLEGKKVSLLCRGITAEDFPALFDHSLAPAGLKFIAAGGTYSIMDRPGGSDASIGEAGSMGHGEFSITLVDGRAKVSTHRPRTPGTVTIFGGQIGRVRPGRLKAVALSVPPLEVESLDDGTVLRGIFASPAGRWAVVETVTKGTPVISALALGQAHRSYRLDWVGWNTATLVKNGREYILPLKP